MRLCSLITGILLLASSSLPVFADQAADQPAEPSAESLAAQGRWIDVDLTSYTATAYDGKQAVYSAPFTAGKPGYETPTGLFQVMRRVDHETMDSTTLGVPKDAPDGYLMKDVRYVQYLRGDGIALHGNYWVPESVFGVENTSHGCVGFRNSDAEYFWDFAAEGTPVLIHSEETVVTPAVAGKNVADATADLQGAGLSVQVIETISLDTAPGQVIKQQPEAGISVKRGSSVEITVAKAPEIAPTPTPTAVPTPTRRTARPPVNGIAWVPDVVGLNEAEARQLIEQAGLTTGYVNYQAEADVAESSRAFFRSIEPGHVVSASPAPGTQVPAGSAVRLAVRKP